MFPPCRTLCEILGLCFGSKVIFSYSAKRTCPILRDILKGCSFCNAVIGISCIGIINISADLANILCH